MDREFIEKVRESIDIVDVISDYVELKKAGRQYKGLCPFHKEKTPSFYVDPDKGVYHCFGCGASGNVFRFLMDIEKITFREAVLQLARRAGIEPPKEKEKGTLERPLKLMELAADFYHKNLFMPQGRNALGYLKRRGVSIETAVKFKLGYALPDGRSFMKTALENGYTEEELISAGLATEREGRVFDTFRDRLMFPIRSVGGTIIAFGGRALSDTAMPKYLNSPDTPFFKKGETLYGLYEVKGNIRDKNVAIVVEGYMDFLMLYQAGLRYGVAPLGTALTENQARIIGRYAKRVYLLYDGDEAGQKAAQRALPILLGAGLKPKVSFLPEGEDPASLIAAGRRDVVIDALRNGVDVIDFYLPENKVDELDSDALTELIEQVLKTVSVASDSIYQNVLLKKLAARTGLDIKVLIGKINIFKSTSKSIVSGAGRRGYRKPSFPSAELRNVLWAFKDERVKEIILKLDESCFEDAYAVELFRALIDGKTIDEILSVGDNELRAFVSKALLDMETEQLDDDGLKIIERFVTDRISQKMVEEIAPNGAVDQTLNRLIELKKEGSIR